MPRIDDKPFTAAKIVICKPETFCDLGSSGVFYFNSNGISATMQNQINLSSSAGTLKKRLVANRKSRQNLLNNKSFP